MKSHANVALGDVSTIVGGGTPRRGVAEYFGGDIPWATPTDVTSLDELHIRATKERITERGLRESSARMLPAGTVLLTSRATIGFTAVTTVPMATNQGFANFVCSEHILPEYLARWLPSQKPLLMQLAGGTTFKEISKSNLRPIEIPLPPLDEQRRIVDILNHAARIERLRAQADETLRAFASSLFIKMFGDPIENPMGWEVKPLGEVLSGQTRNGLSPSRGGTIIAPVLTLSAITRGSFDPTAQKEGTFRTSIPLDQQATRERLLVCRGNGNINLVGRAHYPTIEMTGVAFPDTMIAVRFNPEKLHPTYVETLWATDAFRRQIVRSAKTTNGTHKINQQSIESYLFPIPPMELQARFAQIVATSRSINSAAETATTTASALSASLMSQNLPRNELSDIRGL